MQHTLILAAQMKALKANAAKRYSDHDPFPVLKLFYPGGAATWLITEAETPDDNQAFGLADLGQGSPELGYISLAELRAFRGRLGLKIERDAWFKAAYPLSVYAKAARMHGGITENPEILAAAARILAAEEEGAAA